MVKRPSIRHLFEPQSVAVIGASGDPKKLGYSIVRNIREGGYKGDVYPVNPRGEDILGLKTCRRVEDLPGAVDLATIVIPARDVVAAVRSCAAIGVKHAQIITSGFSETGNAEAEREMVRIARASGMRILGPNIFGLYSSTASLNATFSATGVNAGPVAILTQSGALGIAMIGRAAVDNMGLSSIVSLGNKCDIDEADLLEYLIGHKPTKVILLYIEGVKKGERLLRVLRRATARKPVLAIKSGRSRRGALAAASHTGSLAGSDAVFDAVMKQCGVQRAESLDEAFNWCKFLAENPLPKGNRSVIITNGGGIGVMATDACEKFGIDLYDDQEILKRVFAPVTPPFGSIKNPIDLTGGANSQDYKTALAAPAESRSMDATMALYCETAAFDSANLASMIEETYRSHKRKGKPITYAAVGGAHVEQAVQSLKNRNIPLFSDVYDAVSCMGIAFRYVNYLRERSVEAEEAPINESAINRIIDGALKDNRTFLLANEGIAVLDAAGIAVPGSRIARNITQAVAFAEEIGYPVAMKIVSRHILHKSDAGGVALDLLSREEVIDAFEAILQNVKAYNPQAAIDGIEVTKMVQAGTEIIIGARLDPSFGPIVMCGLGGIYVEVMKDVVFRALPLNRKDVTAMLKEIRSFPLLLGVRGEKRKDIEALISTIIKVGTIINRCRRIMDMEINPVVVYEQGRGLTAVDVRILIRTKEEEPE
ncbi:MAG: acetate--CoA ligase family protein [Deltaproteobacteria bacterium]|nr:acetate--CoA ligase family protein [Deltaproteobacteria bacterium]